MNLGSLILVQHYLSQSTSTLLSVQSYWENDKEIIGNGKKLSTFMLVLGYLVILLKPFN